MKLQRKNHPGFKRIAVKKKLMRISTWWFKFKQFWIVIVDMWYRKHSSIVQYNSFSLCSFSFFYFFFRFSCLTWKVKTNDHGRDLDMFLKYSMHLTLELRFLFSFPLNHTWCQVHRSTNASNASNASNRDTILFSFELFQCIWKDGKRIDFIAECEKKKKKQTNWWCIQCKWENCIRLTFQHNKHRKLVHLEFRASFDFKCTF